MAKGKTHTVSSRFNPLSVEQQAKFNDIDSEEYKNLKEWYDLRLNELWYLALGRKELTEAFCAIAENLKEKPKLRSKTGKIWLLHHFAMLTDHDADPDEVLTQLIKFIQNIHGICLDKRTIDNLISQSIKEIDLEDLDEWTHNAINKRRELGNKRQNR
jgi:transcription termination factor NusB